MICVVCEMQFPSFFLKEIGTQARQRERESENNLSGG
jgi:hypothetical protein